ncbi:hypothetical protein [Methylocapsa palsarum]|uniref:Uncharacterized protein n=1 Tax=Methylocapsa palsarum TaxID=1612308 RepID=A0A1I4BSP6_9HYPH|nr:hypothetical protein [Methylocapsa palsarum]SFK71822.1 hypothetical protein SAMN05444581_11666 [Methylocapsa palsarum]
MTDKPIPPPDDPAAPVKRVMAAPTPEGILAMFAAITGKDPTPEERAAIEARFARLNADKPRGSGPATVKPPSAAPAAPATREKTNAEMTQEEYLAKLLSNPRFRLAPYPAAGFIIGAARRSKPD